MRIDWKREQTILNALGVAKETCERDAKMAREQGEPADVVALFEQSAKQYGDLCAELGDATEITWDA